MGNNAIFVSSRDIAPEKSAKFKQIFLAFFAYF